MKKKIIITGGLGYIGTELCKLYSGVSWQHKIIVIDNRFISERVNQLRNWNIEFVQGDGGINICSKNFAKAIKEICINKKVLLIGDEIQGGIGRTGKIFAYKHYGVNPDIITSAKGLGSGIPIGATIVKKYISKMISTGFHGSTFGGGMLQTRVSYNVLKSINKKAFLNKVKINGKFLSNLLKKMHNNHKDKIVDTKIGRAHV